MNISAVSPRGRPWVFHAVCHPSDASLTDTFVPCSPIYLVRTMNDPTPDDSAHEVPYPPPSGPDHERVSTLRAEVSALEEQLDRREQQLDDVVARYETLLEERTRAASEAEEFVWSSPDEGHPGAGAGTDTELNTDETGLLATVRSLF